MWHGYRIRCEEYHEEIKLTCSMQTSLLLLDELVVKLTTELYIYQLLARDTRNLSALVRHIKSQKKKENKCATIHQLYISGLIILW